MSDWWSTNVISVVAAWSLSDCIKANIGRVVIVATLQALLLRALLRALRIALDLIRQHQIKKFISSQTLRLGISVTRLGDILDFG